MFEETNKYKASKYFAFEVILLNNEATKEIEASSYILMR